MRRSVSRLLTRPRQAVGSKTVALTSSFGVSAGVASSPAPVALHQVRHMHRPDGSVYHPPGLNAASMQLPVDGPEFEAEMNALAKAAHQARNFNDAEALYDRVLALRRNRLGLFHEDVAATLHNLGRVFIEDRKLAAAENALTEAAAIYEKCFGADSIKYADSLALLALCYRDLQFTKEAEKTFKEAIAVFREHCYDHINKTWIPADGVPPPVPNESPLASVAHVLSDASVLFINQDDIDRAINFLEDALEIRRFLYAGSQKFKPIIAQTLVKLAECKRGKGDVTLAENIINEAIDICLDTMGRESPATAAAISSKGNILSLQQRYLEARKCYEEACTTYAMAFGKESPLVASEMIHLGRMMEFTGETGEAEKKYIKATEITRTSLGHDAIQIADVNMYLAQLCMKKMEYDRAIPLLRDSIRIRSKINPNDPQLVFVSHKLGDALAAKRDPEAEAHFMNAIEVHKANYEETKNDSQLLLMTDVLDDLGLHYLQFHMYDKAESMLLESLKIREEKLGENHSSYAYSHSNLAILNLDKKEYTVAIEHCKKSMKSYERASSKDSFMAVTDVQLTLGQALRQLKEYDEAKKVLSKCLTSRRTSGEQGEIQVAETLHEIAKLNIDQKDVFQAAKELDEALAIATKYAGITAELQSAIQQTKKSLATIQP